MIISGFLTLCCGMALHGLGAIAQIGISFSLSSYRYSRDLTQVGDTDISDCFESGCLLKTQSKYMQILTKGGRTLHSRILIVSLRRTSLYHGCRHYNECTFESVVQGAQNHGKFSRVPAHVNISAPSDANRSPALRSPANIPSFGLLVTDYCLAIRLQAVRWTKQSY